MCCIDRLNLPPCTLPASPSEVHVHRPAPNAVQGQQHVPCTQGASQWLLCMESAPLSQRALEDQKLLVEIRQFHDGSYGIYGSPRIHRDLREAGIRCGVKRVARLMN